MGPSSRFFLDYGLALPLPGGSRIWPRQRLAKRRGAKSVTPVPVGESEASPFQDAVKSLLRPYMHEGHRLFSVHAYAAGLGLSPNGSVRVLELTPPLNDQRAATK